MKRIFKERGMGKTTDIVKISAEKQIPILCMSKHCIYDRAKEFNLKIPEPITIKDFMDGKHRGKTIDTILVDESEYILQTLLGIKIYALTGTKPLIVSKEQVGDMIGRNTGDFEIVD